MSFTYRAMQPSDSPALAKLAAVCPDGGMVQFTMQYAVDAYAATQALVLPDMYGVVAESPGTRVLVGAATVSFGPFMFGADERPCALLSNLMVHPDYRRQGVALALTQWRLQKIHECLEENGLVIANIQTGNVASLANANHWCERLVGPLVTAAFPPLARRPRLPKNLTICSAEPHELPEIADHLNTFYRDYNFYQFQTAENLAAWLSCAPGGNPIHHCYVVADEWGNLLAGAALVERYPIIQLHISQVPLPILLVTQALGIMPKDKLLRELEVKHLWYRPGQAAAARALWQALRSEWASAVNCVRVTFDPRSPVKAIVRPAFWVPQTTVMLAIKGSAGLDITRYIDPYLE